jgi:hypothetical protein
VKRYRDAYNPAEAFPFERHTTSEAKIDGVAMAPRPCVYRYATAEDRDAAWASSSMRPARGTP